MEPYRVSEEQIRADQTAYKQNYAPFRPYQFQPRSGEKLAQLFANLITMQNGQDTDDYSVGDNNKVQRYMGHLAPNSRVLILGTGTGRETRVAISIGLDPIGTTLGSRNIDFGTKYLNLAPDRHIEVLNEDLPFAKESFDCVAGFQVFEHAIAPLAFLLEAGRVLKYGGELILEWPPADKFSMAENPHHQICYDPGQAYALFQKAGFQDIHVMYEDGSEIPADKTWSGYHDKMLLIKGRKAETSQEYINKAWA